MNAQWDCDVILAQDPTGPNGTHHPDTSGTYDPHGEWRDSWLGELSSTR
jgi:hypothetical protein